MGLLEFSHFRPDSCSQSRRADQWDDLVGRATGETTEATAERSTFPTFEPRYGTKGFRKAIVLATQLLWTIRRIEDGDYGRARVVEAIPEARLDAIPYAAGCVRCALQQEECDQT